MNGPDWLYVISKCQHVTWYIGLFSPLSYLYTQQYKRYMVFSNIQLIEGCIFFLVSIILNFMWQHSLIDRNIDTQIKVLGLHKTFLLVI